MLVRVHSGIHTRKVQVAHTELGSLDMNWQIDFATAGEILDIAIATVFRATWNGPGSFFADLFLRRCVRTAPMDILWLRRLCDNPIQGIGGDQFSLPSVPFRKNFGGWCAAKDTRVNQTGETDARNVTRGAKDAFQVPDSFRSDRPFSMLILQSSRTAHAFG